jgi:hypothetical protein
MPRYGRSSQVCAQDTMLFSMATTMRLNLRLIVVKQALLI